MRIIVYKRLTLGVFDRFTILLVHIGLTSTHQPIQLEYVN